MGDKWNRAVRDRMAVTGETYTAARKAMLVEKALAGDALALADLERCDAALHRMVVDRIKQSNDAAVDAALVRWAMRGGAP